MGIEAIITVGYAAVVLSAAAVFLARLWRWSHEDQLVREQQERDLREYAQEDYYEGLPR